MQVLQLMRDQRYTFPACIEYEYAGRGTAVEEVQKCLNYAHAALEARGWPALEDFQQDRAPASLPA